MRLSPGDRVATSLADGSFAFEHVAFRTYRVSAAANELYSEIATVHFTDQSDPVTLRMRRGSTLVVRSTRSAPADPGGTVEQTIELLRGAPLSGRVVGPDGAPVADAMVHVAALARGPAARGRRVDRSRSSSAG